MAVWKIAEQVETTGPVDQRHDRRAASRPDDEIALKMADLATTIGDLGPQTDQVEQAEWAGPLRDLTGTAPGLPAPSPAMQTAGQSGRQSSPSVSIDALVDRLGRHGLATDAAGTSELDGDRHRRVECCQPRLDVICELSVRLELRQSRTSSLCSSTRFARHGAVAEPTAIASDLHRDRRCRSAEAPCDGRERVTARTSDTNFLALFHAQCCTCHAGTSNGSSLGWCRSS